MRRALVPVLAATLLLSVAGCSSDDESPKAGAPASAGAPLPSESSEPAQTTAAPSSEAEVKTDTIKDDMLGHTIDATGIVRNFPCPKSMSAVEERRDTELVLVDIKAKAGKAYFVSLSDGDFRLSATEDDAEPAMSTSTAETEMGGRRVQVGRGGGPGQEWWRLDRLYGARYHRRPAFPQLQATGSKQRGHPREGEHADTHEGGALCPLFPSPQPQGSRPAR